MASWKLTEEGAGKSPEEPQHRKVALPRVLAEHDVDGSAATLSAGGAVLVAHSDWQLHDGHMDEGARKSPEEPQHCIVAARLCGISMASWELADEGAGKSPGEPNTARSQGRVGETEGTAGQWPQRERGDAPTYPASAHPNIPAA